MIVVMWQQIVLAIGILFGSIYFMIEHRLKKHEAIVAEYIQRRDKRTTEMFAELIDYIDEEKIK